MTDPLTAWLRDHAPALANAFAEPVDPAHVADAEKELGRALPAAYVAFLREHDGQRWIEGEEEGVGTLAQIFDAFEILGIRHAAGEWRSMCEWGDDAVKRFWPFTTIGGESRHHCFDEEGRVVVVSMKDPERIVVSESFDDFIARLVAILEEGATIEDDAIVLGDDALDWLMGES